MRQPRSMWNFCAVFAVLKLEGDPRRRIAHTAWRGARNSCADMDQAGRTRQRSPGRSYITGQRHHESNVGSYSTWHGCTRGKWRRCTTANRRSNSRSASFACSWAGLRVYAKRGAAIPIARRPIRIVFARASAVSKSGSRALCKPIVLFVAVARNPDELCSTQGIMVAGANIDAGRRAGAAASGLRPCEHRRRDISLSRKSSSFQQSARACRA
jgi:hypothetical protein